MTNSIASLSQSAILGGLLAVFAIFIFLRNFRSTLIIGSAIPLSVLTVFLIMYLMRQFGSNITLNLISMMGLMVAIGMLVDPAVVALENIFRKRFDEGQDATRAALEGSDEIGLPRARRVADDHLRLCPGHFCDGFAHLVFYARLCRDGRHLRHCLVLHRALAHPIGCVARL